MMNSNDVMKKQVLKGLCTGLAIVALPLAVGNAFFFDNKSYLLAFIECLYFIVALYSLYDIRNDRNIALHIYLHVFIIAFIMFFGEIVKPIDEGVYIWSTAAPLLFYLLLGSSNAFIYSILFLFIQIGSLLFEIALHDKNQFFVSVLNFICTYLVITAISRKFEMEREAAQNHIQYLGAYDPLTGALSRNSLIKEMNEHSERYSSFVMFNIDDLSHYTKKYGYKESDKMIKEITRRLANTIDKECLYYLGSGKFVALFFTYYMAESSYHGCQQLNDMLSSISSDPFSMRSNQEFITFSAGITEITKFATIESIWSDAEDNVTLAQMDGVGCVFKNNKLFIKS
uniref:GGDEF domain-containing protein n=1 Tax=Aliivibrio wodanis TaxID=80852 RepID=A0A5Q4YYS3_9GAMM|nr:hypothetical protein AW0309160_03119 [Aliivibrio wodanis]